MRAGLIAGRSLLWNGLLTLLGIFVFANGGVFATSFAVGIAHPSRGVCSRVVTLPIPVASTTHGRLPYSHRLHYPSAGPAHLLLRDFAHARQSAKSRDIQNRAVKKLALARSRGTCPRFICSQ